mmetsp:Transcript_63680/g.170627  ORF Transcript_63680/g.170627 Transcript_63680/m.170627 type:complete len:291 (+) Transcript_63680:676-1548(+)
MHCSQHLDLPAGLLELLLLLHLLGNLTTQVVKSLRNEVLHHRSPCCVEIHCTVRPHLRHTPSKKLIPLSSAQVTGHPPGLLHVGSEIPRFKVLAGVLSPLRPLLLQPLHLPQQPPLALCQVSQPRCRLPLAHASAALQVKFRLESTLLELPRLLLHSIGSGLLPALLLALEVVLGPRGDAPAVLRGHLGLPLGVRGSHRVRFQLPPSLFLLLLQFLVPFPALLCVTVQISSRLLLGALWAPAARAVFRSALAFRPLCGQALRVRSGTSVASGGSVPPFLRLFDRVLGKTE